MKECFFCNCQCIGITIKHQIGDRIQSVPICEDCKGKKDCRYEA